MGASIPLPIACKAIALPFELITLNLFFPFVHYNITHIMNQLILYLYSMKSTPRILSSGTSNLLYSHIINLDT